MTDSSPRRARRRTAGLVALFTFGAGGGAVGASLPELGSCGSPATRIHEIQGPGRSSPIAGASDVTVEAVVVGVFPGFPDGLGGFFVQEEDGDHDLDPVTSEGLFVFDGDLDEPLDVRIGDVVRLRGEVREFFGMTELSRLAAASRCPDTALATPVPLALPIPEVDPSGPSFWERFEGMAVSLDGPLVVVDQYAAGRFGEVDLAVTRLWQATQHVAPGPEAIAWHEADERRRILLDDGRSSIDPDPWPYLQADGGSLRLGDRVPGLEGVLDFAFGRFRIQPTRTPRFETQSLPPPPPEVPGTLRVVAWNLENLFNGDGRGGGFPSRGAASHFEYQRQLAKIAATLFELDADVLALVELENDGIAEDSTLGDLATALWTLEPSVEYALVDPGTSLGSHAISVGLLYRASTVVPAGMAAVLDERAQVDFDSTRNRPSLAQTFRHVTSGRLLTVVANHLKSKGSSCEAAGDPDREDGQGNCNETRRRAARALADWLAGDPTASGGAPVLIVGDLNAHPLEDPLSELTRAGFVDLLARFDSPNAFTFVFDGRAGRLDHALASPSLVSGVGGAAVWNVNADESPALGYGEENPQGLYHPDPRRASDHDPVIVGLFPAPEPSPSALASAALVLLAAMRLRTKRSARSVGSAAEVCSAPVRSRRRATPRPRMAGRSKLYRRMARYFDDGNQGLSGFDASGRRLTSSMRFRSAGFAAR